MPLTFVDAFLTADAKRRPETRGRLLRRHRRQCEIVYKEKFVRDLVHDVVQTIKRTLKVDWTEPPRDHVRAEMRAAVKRVLRRRGLREADFDPFVARFVQQAEAQYAEWPLVV